MCVFLVRFSLRQLKLGYGFVFVFCHAYFSLKQRIVNFHENTLEKCTFKLKLKEKKYIFKCVHGNDKNKAF